MYFSKTPGIIRWAFPKILWNIPQSQNTIYLTFDDGPNPGITEWVLDTLLQFDIKATFFCIGKNVANHPSLYQRILNEGHQVGNHSYSHNSGWSVSHREYKEDVARASSFISSPFFRPPYGRIRYSQYRALSNYKIVMWDIMSGDFDKSISSEKCASNVIDQAVNGSIIVYHDSERAAHHLKASLKIVIGHFKKKGFQFGVLPND